MKTLISIVKYVEDKEIKMRLSGNRQCANSHVSKFEFFVAKAAKGNKTELIEGNYDLVVKGDFTQVVKGKSRILSDNDMTIGCGSSMLGSLRIVTGDNLSLEGDLTINGAITATNITSDGWVSAAQGVNAGPYGFVSVLGGLSVGVPVAIPGCVTAALVVKAPLGDFGTMSAVLMTDIINASIFDTHLHLAKGKETSPPLFGMI